MIDFSTRLIAKFEINTSPLPDVTAGPETMQRILSTVFVILGATSVLVITIAGFRYVISHGDPKSVEQSKNAILGAVVGLIICIAAFAIVNFVIGSL